jgi:hypothetical protein
VPCSASGLGCHSHTVKSAIGTMEWGYGYCTTVPSKSTHGWIHTPLAAMHVPFNARMHSYWGVTNASCAARVHTTLRWGVAGRQRREGRTRNYSWEGTRARRVTDVRTMRAESRMGLGIEPWKSVFGVRAKCEGCARVHSHNARLLLFLLIADPS